MAGRFSGLYRLLTGWDLSRALELVRPLFGLLQGIPTDQPLASTYWRKRTPPPAAMDPNQDGCGLLWCSPVAPADGAQAEELVALASEIMLRYGFEPAISLTMITERSLACVISITYDRHVPGEDEKASACYRELLRRLSDGGFHCYRMTSQSSGGIKRARAMTACYGRSNGAWIQTRYWRRDGISHRSNIHPLRQVGHCAVITG